MIVHLQLLIFTQIIHVFSFQFLLRLYCIQFGIIEFTKSFVRNHNKEINNHYIICSIIKG